MPKPWQNSLNILIITRHHQRKFNHPLSYGLSSCSNQLAYARQDDHGDNDNNNYNEACMFTFKASERGLKGREVVDLLRLLLSPFRHHQWSLAIAIALAHTHSTDRYPSWFCVEGQWKGKWTFKNRFCCLLIGKWWWEFVIGRSFIGKTMIHSSSSVGRVTCQLRYQLASYPVCPTAFYHWESISTFTLPLLFSSYSFPRCLCVLFLFHNWQQCWTTWWEQMTIIVFCSGHLFKTFYCVRECLGSFLAVEKKRIFNIYDLKGGAQKLGMESKVKL